MDVALIPFDGVDTAARAYADARDRSGPARRWQVEVGFIEHHEDGHPYTSEDGAVKGRLHPEKLRSAAPPDDELAVIEIALSDEPVSAS